MCRILFQQAALRVSHTRGQLVRILSGGAIQFHDILLLSIVEHVLSSPVVRLSVVLLL
jgi:hypothetical protein